MCSKNLTDRISDIKIGYEYCIYDHFPVFFHISVKQKSDYLLDSSENECGFDKQYENENAGFINWEI